MDGRKGKREGDRVSTLDNQNNNLNKKEKKRHCEKGKLKVPD